MQRKKNGSNFNEDSGKEFTKRFIIKPNKATSSLNKEIEDFICSNSILLFNRFKIIIDFLTIDPSNWENDECFTNATAKIKKKIH